MKRRDALRKMRSICEGLDQVGPRYLFIRPLKLYLFGSVLADKPDSNNIAHIGIVCANVVLT